MKILQPYAEIWLQDIGSDVDDIKKSMLQHIERCGRTCYKSENHINSESYLKFVKMLENANHTAMLEHGTIYLRLTIGSPIKDVKYFLKMDLINFFERNPYSKCKKHKEDVNYDGTSFEITAYYITTNYRVIFEHNMWEKIKDYVVNPCEYHEQRITVHFSTDIGVTRELNRHRVDSMAEQSTRYCNYGKDKFNNEISINQSAWLTDDMLKEDMKDFGLFVQEFPANVQCNIGEGFWSAIEWWLFANMVSERAYMELITKGWKPEQARTVLPLDTHSELIHTAFVSDWKHLIDLRSNGTTGKPHPDAKKVVDVLKEELQEIYPNINW